MRTPVIRLDNDASGAANKNYDNPLATLSFVSGKLSPFKKRNSINFALIRAYIWG